MGSHRRDWTRRFGALALVLCATASNVRANDWETCATTLAGNAAALRRAVLGVGQGLVTAGPADPTFFSRLQAWEKAMAQGDLATRDAAEAKTAELLKISLVRARVVVSRLVRRLPIYAAASEARDPLADALRDQSPWFLKLFPDGPAPAPVEASAPWIAAAFEAVEDGAWASDVWQALSLLPARATDEPTDVWVDRQKDVLSYLWGAVAEGALLGENESLLPGPAIRVDGKRHADAWDAELRDGALVVHRFVEAKASLAGLERATRQPSGFVARLFGSDFPHLVIFGRSYEAQSLRFRLVDRTASFADTRALLRESCVAFPDCEPGELSKVFGPQFFTVAFPADHAAFLGNKGPALYPTTRTRDELVAVLVRVLERALGAPVSTKAVVRAIGAARRSDRPLPVWDAFRRRTGRSDRYVPARGPVAEELTWLSAIAEKRRGASGDSFVSDPARFFRDVLGLLVPGESDAKSRVDGELATLLKESDVDRAQHGRREPLDRVRQAIVLVEGVRTGATPAADRPLADVTLEWSALIGAPPAPVAAPVAGDRVQRFLDRKNGSAHWLPEFSAAIRLFGFGYQRNTRAFFERLLRAADEPRRANLKYRYDAIGLKDWDGIGATQKARGNRSRAASLAAASRVLQVLDLALEAMAPAGTVAIDAPDRDAVAAAFAKYKAESWLRYGLGDGSRFASDSSGGLHYFRELSARGHRTLPGIGTDTHAFFRTLVEAVSENDDDLARYEAIGVRKLDAHRAGTADDGGRALVRLRAAVRLVIEIALGETIEKTMSAVAPEYPGDPLNDYRAVASLVARTKLEERVFGVVEADLRTFVRRDGGLPWLEQWSRRRKDGDPRRTLREDPARFFYDFLDRAVPNLPKNADARRACLDGLEGLELGLHTFANAIAATKDVANVARHRAPLVKIVKAMTLVAKAIRATSDHKPTIRASELVQPEAIEALMKLGAPVGGWPH